MENISSFHIALTKPFWGIRKKHIQKERGKKTEIGLNRKERMKNRGRKKETMLKKRGGNDTDIGPTPAIDKIYLSYP